MLKFDSFDQIVRGTPLDIQEWELDLNVHISLKLGMISRKNSGASRWESPKLNPWLGIITLWPANTKLNPWGAKLWDTPQNLVLVGSR